VRGMDPFAFMSDILKAGVVISEYDGDGKLIETFTSETSVDGVVVTVKRPNADGTAGGDVNGTYSIGYDSGGNCVSLVAKGSDGSVSWEEDLANFNDMWSSLESAASAIFDETMSYGSMVESMIPKKEAETVSKIQENFVYSLMF